MTKSMLETAPRVYRATDKHTGWREIFTPADGALRHLTYARLIFAPDCPSHKLDTGGREWAVFCIRGPVVVVVGGAEFSLDARDMLYLPRGCAAELRGAPGADLALGGCPAESDSKPQLVRFPEVKDDPAFFFDVGTAELGTRRRIHNMIAHNVKASRLLAGFTIGDPTAWTSWPPHEHSTTKEEFYLFFDMPPPASSVQFVYSSPEAMEFREVVREGDCVTIPGGYHPTAAMPGTQSCFLWVMAAFNPVTDRDFKHGITIQPEYAGVKFV
jgi:5-deoxy-glucuronate isomerase